MVYYVENQQSRYIPQWLHSQVGELRVRAGYRKALEGLLRQHPCKRARSEISQIEHLPSLDHVPSMEPRLFLFGVFFNARESPVQVDRARKHPITRRSSACGRKHRRQGTHQFSHSSCENAPLRIDMNSLHIQNQRKLRKSLGKTGEMAKKVWIEETRTHHGEKSYAPLGLGKAQAEHGRSR